VPQDPKKLVGEVQMFRIRVATAESKLKLLREQARQAKRRRKETKRFAQRARKQFKRFKDELTELQQALAKAEAKLFQAGGRALARKTAKAKAIAKRSARPSKKSKTGARQPRPALSRASRLSRRVARKKPAIRKVKVGSDGPADVAALDHMPSTPQIPGPNS
jgi:chromosome segregation ATPase